MRKPWSTYSYITKGIVDDEDIKRKHKEVLDYLDENPESTFYHVSSGCSIVFGSKNSDGYIDIYEIKNGYDIFHYEKIAPHKLIQNKS